MPAEGEWSPTGAWRRLAQRLVEVLCALQFAGLFGAAALWWWMMPKGFPLLHERFWINSVFPPLAMVASGWALWTISRGKHLVLRRMQLTVLACVVSAGVTGMILYPTSMAAQRLAACTSVLVAATLLQTALVGLAFGWIRGLGKPLFAIIPAAVLLGVFIPRSQLGRPSKTSPTGVTMPDHSLIREPVSSRSISLGSNFIYQASIASLITRHRDTSLTVDPLLDFQSVSPDRFWTLFSPRGVPRLRVGNAFRDAKKHLVEYRGIWSAAVLIEGGRDSNRVDLTAHRYLPGAVYSHLNSYSQLFFTGNQPLFVSFSPCPEKIEILPSDYPTGRPARFAAMMPDGMMRVVEASSGEKGPFKVLTEGRIERGDPIALTLWNGEIAVYRVTFHDWSAQASTQLSPTAGWGMPENAVEFSLSDVGYAASFHLTLAGTSVGRGWDSVGHAEGVYRNRMSIELLAEPDSDPVGH